MNIGQTDHELLLRLYTARSYDFEALMLDMHVRAEECLKWVDGKAYPYSVRMSLAPAIIDRSVELLEDAFLEEGRKVRSIAQADVLVFKTQEAYDLYMLEGLIIYKELN